MAIVLGNVPTVMVAITAWVAVSITETLPTPSTPDVLRTYANVPSGLNATDSGKGPTGTVSTTVLVAVEMIDTFPAGTAFVTYTKAPSGVTPTPMGFIPTGTAVTTVCVIVSITDTLFESAFAT